MGLIGVVLVLATMQGGPAYFLQLGAESRNLDVARDVFGADVPTPVADGHDGENFWMLARDPLLLDDDASSRFDRPAYRAQRIAYPLAAAPWGLAGDIALAWGLVLTNVGVAALGTYLTARLAVASGLRPEFGYVFALNPMVILALLFDFSDAVALLGLVGAVLAAVEGRHQGAAGWSSVGALGKESILVALASAAFLSRRLDMRIRAALVVPAAVVVGAWRLYVLSRPGFGGDPRIQEFEAVPLRGYVDAWERSWRPLDGWPDAVVAMLLLVAAIAAVALWLRGGRRLVASAVIGPAVLLLFLSAQVVSLPTNSLRAGGPILTFLVLGIAALRSSRNEDHRDDVKPIHAG